MICLSANPRQRQSEGLLVSLISADKTASLQAAIEQEQNVKSILVRDYRTRLIADVVTGKVDVRHLADRAASEPTRPSDDEASQTMITEMPEDEESELSCQRKDPPMPTTDTPRRAGNADRRSLVSRRRLRARPQRGLRPRPRCGPGATPEFLAATQPEAAEALQLGEDGPKRHAVFAPSPGEIAKRHVIDVLRNGIKHGPLCVDLSTARRRPETPRRRTVRGQLFSVTRQLRYSKDETQLALDLGLFINGLPVATFESKNRLTKQTVEDAVRAV